MDKRILKKRLNSLVKDIETIYSQLPIKEIEELVSEFDGLTDEVADKASEASEKTQDFWNDAEVESADMLDKAEQFKDMVDTLNDLKDKVKEYLENM